MSREVPYSIIRPSPVIVIVHVDTRVSKYNSKNEVILIPKSVNLIC